MLKVRENTSPIVTSEANLRDYRASVFTNFEHILCIVTLA